MDRSAKRREWAVAIKAARAAVGWTQEQLAWQSGFSLSYVQKIENAKDGSAYTVDELLAVMKNGKKK